MEYFQLKKKKEKYKVDFSMVQKATLKKWNIFYMGNETNCLGDEITVNSFKKYKYLRQIIFFSVAFWALEKPTL